MNLQLHILLTVHVISNCIAIATYSRARKPDHSEQNCPILETCKCPSPQNVVISSNDNALFFISLIIKRVTQHTLYCLFLSLVRSEETIMIFFHNKSKSNPTFSLSSQQIRATTTPSISGRCLHKTGQRRDQGQ